MIPNRTRRARRAERTGAVVIDFEAARAARRSRALDDAESQAETLLARVEAGEADWRELVTALLGPFDP